jgi:hypothetical protein
MASIPNADSSDQKLEQLIGAKPVQRRGYATSTAK